MSLSVFFSLLLLLLFFFFFRPLFLTVVHSIAEDRISNIAHAYCIKTSDREQLANHVENLLATWNDRTNIK